MSVKKITAALLVLIAVLLSSCANIKQPSDEEMAKAYESAREAMGWFRLTTMPLAEGGDVSAVAPEGSSRVEHPTIKTYDDLEKYLKSLFSDKIVQELLADKRYFDVDGQLYAIAADRGSDITKGNETYEVVRESNKKIIYRVTVEDLGDDLTTVTGHTVTDMVYEYNDAGWIFTSFELVR